MDEAPDLTDTDRRVLLVQLRGLVDRSAAVVDKVERDLGVEDE